MAAPPRPATPRARRFDAALVAAGFATAFAVVAGFFGESVPLLDTLGQFRAHLAAALVLLALALSLHRFFLAAFAAALAAALGLSSTLPLVLPQGEAAGVLPASMPRYTLLQMNLRYDTEDKQQAIRRILDLDPDVVTLQEMTVSWQTAFETISDRYPYQSYCSPGDAMGDVAILSRRPFVEGVRSVCEPKASFEARVVDFDGHPVTVGAQHLRWPYPGRQWSQIERVSPALGKLATPLVIGGDFNAAPWSAAIRVYAAAAALRVVAGIGPTYAPAFMPDGLRRRLGLPIDNVLVSNEIVVLSTKRPEATASDHSPVLVSFAIPFPKSAEPEVQSVGLIPTSPDEGPFDLR
ncbi:MULTISPECIES: endonuclease/exonuclease/phosphatase family protein [unclassified Aureimonas]|uniref:endonuclease/exonuclease/phosphatase family protein n=1 Tax=unclassified Aureimonas TaxID=2615206 RepID=UPI00070107B6|nr:MULTISPECIES: endonuclease/exonuclease/phosphatase family protein [unclassified Aureimonas]KQT55292.1 hypothetical protein ASG62_10740 [Aureimonas sp. Leaf427]KQT71084.1 hypothetical protein ASG54_21125 [Aureimonas sp. Leaf460]